jgi:hypothetical protein
MTRLGSRAAALTLSSTLALTTFFALSPHAGAQSTACGNSDLSITHTPTDSATGHSAFVLLFRNVTHRTCTLHGYPGLDALSKSGHVLAHAKRRLHGFAGGASAVRTITVRPGRFASATVEWLNFNAKTAGVCRFSKSVAVTPANTTRTVHFRVSVSVCNLEIHPTVAGTSHNYRYAKAQQQWIAGSRVSFAAEGRYWARAARQLKAPSAHGGYATQVAMLRQLIALPDADQSPAQNATYRHDVRALDAFFGTPRLYL